MNISRITVYCYVFQNVSCPYRELLSPLFVWVTPLQLSLLSHTELPCSYGHTGNTIVPMYTVIYSENYVVTVFIWSCWELLSHLSLLSHILFLWSVTVILTVTKRTMHCHVYSYGHTGNYYHSCPHRHILNYHYICLYGHTGNYSLLSGCKLISNSSYAPSPTFSVVFLPLLLSHTELQFIFQGGRGGGAKQLWRDAVYLLSTTVETF